MTKEIANKLFDADICFERVIWLAALGLYESLTDTPFKDFVEAVCDHPVEDILDGLEFLRKFTDDPDTSDYPDVEDVACAFINRGKFGVLVEAATPYHNYMGKPGSIYQSGWGHYHTQWLYADSLEEAAGKALIWAAKMDALDKERTSKP